MIYVTYITKKVDMYTWSPFVMQLNFFTVNRTETFRVVQSKGTVQPQAHPKMLYSMCLVIIKVTSST